MNNKLFLFIIISWLALFSAYGQGLKATPDKPDIYEDGLPFIWN